MNEKRKKFLEENKIPQGGFREKFAISEHVEVVLSNHIGEKPYFIGFDGKSKKWEELTELERQDYLENNSVEKKIKSLHEFCQEKNIGKEPGE